MRKELFDKKRRFAKRFNSRAIVFVQTITVSLEVYKYRSDF